MDKDLEYLKYLAVKNREVDFSGIVRFNKDSKYIYPKDVDYSIESIYMWDDVGEEFEFRITRIDNTLPIMPDDPTRTHTYTVVREKHLNVIEFDANIRGTEIQLTYDEMKRLMLVHHPKFESKRKVINQAL